MCNCNGHIFVMGPQFSGHQLLLPVLKAELGARIQMPSVEEIRQYQFIVSTKHHNLVDVWFVVDGLKLYLEAKFLHLLLVG